ncbi:hypothetical protein JK159_03880 [Weissella minor]|uniref:hypothetical protein n=1 Tax=Weissella minor TaxID=1620 RepID=UPI001BAF5025|nr:hypothetical protein [Weissella minor]MBS0949518.1 hypothetical protein [Weissella minor]
MAFNINTLLVNKVPMKLGTKTVTAEYTNDADQRYSDFMLHLGNIQKKLEDDNVEDMAFDDQQQLKDDIHEQAMGLGKEYIDSLFNEKDAEIVMDAINGREENLANVTYYLHQLGDASSDEYKAAMEKPNREAKRTSDHKKSKKD